MRNEAEYRRNRNAENPAVHEARKAASRAWKARRYAEVRALVDEAKDKPCVDCGKKYPTVAMDLDHVRGTKEFNLSHAARNGASIERIKQEIAKCDVRCAICHRLRHAAEGVMPCTSDSEDCSS